MSRLLDRRTSIDLVKLLVFVVVTTMATAVLVVTIGNLTFGDYRTYKAEFTEVTGVNKGDDIRVAGVRVGTVEDIEIVERSAALVTFTVDSRTQVNGGTNARIRYRNLVGQRYISLTQAVGDTRRLPAGSTIPVSRTRAALDLTVLFNGFKPLFQALSPEVVNELSYELILVFQGEAGTLEGLLAHTASVTSTLADRDEVIGDLIDNLSLVLDHVADRDEQLTRLIQSFRTLVGGLKKDRNAILGSLEDVSALSVETLDEGDTIPIERTSPALDLTVLFNVFKPLFQALSPDDVNKLSYEVVQVFQGEGGTLENLLGHTASITQTLADRDQVIGDLIDNLDFVLDHVADRDDQLSDLIVSFRDLVGGLKDDREAILASLDGISALSVQTADLVKGIRPSFVEDVKQLRRFAGNVDKNKAELDRALQVLPIKLEKIGRTAIYGSFFNFYLCEFSAQVTLPGNIDVVKIPKYSSGANRCDLG